MTVGKKLKPKDFPDKAATHAAQEIYDYVNISEPTGRMGRLVGVSLVVGFPGGSGRIWNDFRMFDLKNGHQINFQNCLLDKSQSEISTLFCEYAKKHVKTSFDPSRKVVSINCARSGNI